MDVLEKAICVLTMTLETKWTTSRAKINRKLIERALIKSLLVLGDMESA